MNHPYGMISYSVTALFFLSFLLPINANGKPADDGVRVVFVRHGEKTNQKKPDEDIRQLSCKGLNRSLALPPVIAKLFGRPNFLLAPNPSHLNNHSDDPTDDTPRDYVRAVATIEPTAIFFGLPVDAALDVSDLGALQAAIEKIVATNRNALVLVAWEHKRIPIVLRALLSSHGGDSQHVPDWQGDDYDSIYMVTIGASKATFSQNHEGLNGQPDLCPQ
jgi:hypothetical protein